HDLAAFQHDRPEAGLRQDQGREQAAGTGTNYDGSLFQFLWSMGHKAVCHVWRRSDLGDVALQHGGFVANLSVDDIDENDGGFLPRVMSALEDGEPLQVAR